MWAKALVITKGDEQRRKAEYIKLRAKRLAEAENQQQSMRIPMVSSPIQIEIQSQKELQEAHKTKDTSLQHLQNNAEYGDVLAQFQLAIMYEEGRELPQDYSQAVAWYKKSAENGYALVQNKLGQMYAQGLGVDKDENQAFAWYQKAAEQNLPEAQVSLGHMYRDGLGVDQDNVQAISWYEKAAQQGFAAAQYILGLCYANGRDVPPNNMLAEKHYGLAAKQGYEGAQEALKLLGYDYDGYLKRMGELKQLLVVG